jgi:hypothetical protein
MWASTSLRIPEQPAPATQTSSGLAADVLVTITVAGLPR